MKLVIAGNYKQFRNWLRENHLDPSEYVYAHNYEGVVGHRYDELLQVGTYWENPFYLSEGFHKMMRAVKGK